MDGIVPGTTYRLAVSAKVSDASETVFVGVNFLDQAGAAVGSTQLSTKSISYTALGADIVAPPDAARAVVYVWKNAGSGLAYVDDFAFGVARAPRRRIPGLPQPRSEWRVARTLRLGELGNAAGTGSRAGGAQVGTGAGSSARTSPASSPARPTA